MRAVRIARSVGRPSRLKKPPGIFPAAYMRSSTSTVSGKKSAPSRVSIRPWAVASTIVSPERTSTAPSACLASLPVSKTISSSPTVTETEMGCSVAILMLSSTLLRLGEWRFESAPAAVAPRLAQTSTLHSFLPPEAELLDQSAIALDVPALEVVQQAPPPPDQLEQAAARMVVLRVRAH